MARLVESLARQRRFRLMLALLLVLSMTLGLAIVPIESRSQHSLINTMFDGIWWAFTTITSVGYGDVYPVTVIGKIIGMILEVVGVLAFGLLIGMIATALDEVKNKFYWKRMFERMDVLEKKIEQLQQQSSYVVKKDVEEDSDRE